MFKKILLIALLIASGILIGNLYKKGSLLPKSKRKTPAQLTSIVPFREACKKAYQDERAFAAFKRDPIYSLFYENLTCDQGKEMIALLEQRAPSYLQESYLTILRQVDQVGGARLFSYDGIGHFSPSTLRYLKIAADLRDHFGKLDEMEIVEIGGGSATLCSIIHQIDRPKSYTIIDLPEALELTKKVLEKQGIKGVVFKTPDRLPAMPCDLVISDYGFTEASHVLQTMLLNQVVASAKRGYLTCGFYPKHFRIRPWKKEVFIKRLQKAHPNFAFFAEEPQTGADNFTAIWTPV